MSSPGISVIICTYNRKDVLERAWAAYRNQTFRDFEVIVTSDGSSDGTDEMMEALRGQSGYPLHYIRQADNGFRKSLAVNKAIRLATGRILVFADDDMIPPPRYLESYARVFDSASNADALLVYSSTVKVLGGMSPITFFKGMAPAMMMAFSSASSVGALPFNLECTERLGARREVSSFVLPLGATINMDGTAIYQGVCAVFIATAYGIDLTVGQMLTIVLTATLASVGTAGVPGAGMVMLAMVLQSVKCWPWCSRASTSPWRASPWWRASTASSTWAAPR